MKLISQTEIWCSFPAVVFLAFWESITFRNKNTPTGRNPKVLVYVTITMNDPIRKNADTSENGIRSNPNFKYFHRLLRLVTGLRLIALMSHVVL